MTEPSNPTSEGRTETRDSRERILDAAADVLAANPSASLTDIAASAGVSRATVYRHFSDVAAVRAAFVAEAQAIGRNVLRDVLPTFLEREAGVTTEDLVGFTRQILPIEHRWTRLIAGEPLPDAPIVEAFLPVVQAILRRGQQQGEFRADLDVELAADAMVALVMLAVRKVHAQGVDPDRAAEMIRVYLEGLRPVSRR